jgi:fructosamine-3-kinase
VNLQPLFASPILEQLYVNRDYEDFANDVWIVRTADEHVVVRISRHEGVLGAFRHGVARLFGVEFTVRELRLISDAVNETTGFQAPRVLRTGIVDGRAYAITDVLPGRNANSFDTLSPAQARSFGRALARAHQRTFDFCGSPASDLSYPLAEFHVRAADTIEWVANRYRTGHARDVEIAAHAAAALRELPPPPASSLILYDIGASQYLWDDSGATSVVDTEVYVYAPRELELMALESASGPAFCEAFRRGYQTVSLLPDVAPYRDPYRCLLALTETEGLLPLADALAAPVWF